MFPTRRNFDVSVNVTRHIRHTKGRYICFIARVVHARCTRVTRDDTLYWSFFMANATALNTERVRG